MSGTLGYPSTPSELAGVFAQFIDPHVIMASAEADGLERFITSRYFTDARAVDLPGIYGDVLRFLNNIIKLYFGKTVLPLNKRIAAHMSDAGHLDASNLHHCNIAAADEQWWLAVAVVPSDTNLRKYLRSKGTAQLSDRDLLNLFLCTMEMATLSIFGTFTQDPEYNQMRDAFTNSIPSYEGLNSLAATWATPLPNRPQLSYRSSWGRESTLTAIRRGIVRGQHGRVLERSHHSTKLASGRYEFVGVAAFGECGPIAPTGRLSPDKSQAVHQPPHRQDGLRRREHRFEDADSFSNLAHNTGQYDPELGGQVATSLMGGAVHCSCTGSINQSPSRFQRRPASRPGLVVDLEWNSPPSAANVTESHQPRIRLRCTFRKPCRAPHQHVVSRVSI